MKLRKQTRLKRVAKPKGAYVNVIMKLLESGGIQPGISEITVAHDTWCAIFRGQACNCAPAVKIQEVK